GGLRPGDDFNERATWEEVLEPHGWVKDRTIGGEIRWTRPDKDGGTSATTGHNDGGFHVFTCNAPPFEAHENRDKFGIYALLNHNGDFDAAAKALAEKGYGTKSANKRPRGEKGDRNKQKTQAELLIDLASDAALFHDSEHRGFAEIKVEANDDVPEHAEV